MENPFFFFFQLWRRMLQLHYFISMHVAGSVQPLKREYVQQHGISLEHFVVIWVNKNGEFHISPGKPLYTLSFPFLNSSRETYSLLLQEEKLPRIF